MTKKRKDWSIDLVNYKNLYIWINSHWYWQLKPYRGYKALYLGFLTIDWN